MRKQSLFHISKRDALPLGKALLIRGGILLLALVFCGLVTTLLTGQNPISVYGTILDGCLRHQPPYLASPPSNVAILLGISLAVTPAFKMRFWNIGAEGQTLIGCLATTACMIMLGDKLPNAALILVIPAGRAAGRRSVGLPARLLQGQVEHQRDPVHPDDELHCHAAGLLLHHHLGGAQGCR